HTSSHFPYTTLFRSTPTTMKTHSNICEAVSAEGNHCQIKKGKTHSFKHPTADNTNSISVAKPPILPLIILPPVFTFMRSWTKKEPPRRAAARFVPIIWIGVERNHTMPLL